MAGRLRTRAQRGLGPRPKSLRRRVLERQVIHVARELALEPPAPPPPPRPTTRGECAPCPICEAHNALESPPAVDVLACGHRAAHALNHCRPCARVSCRYNLYLDVKETGILRMNFPDREFDQLKETCALDVADRVERGHIITHEQIGDLVNMHRERVRQLEESILDKVAVAIDDPSQNLEARHLEPRAANPQRPGDDEEKRA